MGSPAGQCGVTSVWLARKLRSDFGIEAMYCYGKLEFAGAYPESVDRHCWLEVTSISGATTVIDLTADQAVGFTEPIIVAEEDSLRARGIYYRARIKKPLDVLPDDAVWTRYLVLADSMIATFPEAA